MDGFKFKDRFPTSLSGRGSKGKATLKTGDRFFQTQSLRSVWVVEKVFIPRGLDYPHAVLIRDGEQTDRRMVAEGALLDQSLYRRDHRAGAGRHKKGCDLHRRRLDMPRGLVRQTVN